MRRLAIATFLALPLPALAQTPPTEAQQQPSDAATALGQEYGACIQDRLAFHTQVLIAQRQTGELQKQVANLQKQFDDLKAKAAAPAEPPK